MGLRARVRLSIFSALPEVVAHIRDHLWNALRMSFLMSYVGVKSIKIWPRYRPYCVKKKSGLKGMCQEVQKCQGAQRACRWEYQQTYCMKNVVLGTFYSRYRILWLPPCDKYWILWLFLQFPIPNSHFRTVNLYHPMTMSYWILWLFLGKIWDKIDLFLHYLG